MEDPQEYPEFPGVTERLRAAMKLRGFWDEEKQAPSAAKFCRQYGYDPRHLSMWVNPRNLRRPSLRNIRRLAHDLEISWTYLLLGPTIWDGSEWTLLLRERRSMDVRVRSAKRVRPPGMVGRVRLGTHEPVREPRAGVSSTRIAATPRPVR